MPKDVPPRGQLTDDLVAYLVSAVAAPSVVGDGAPPDAAGWNGQPQQGLFTASVTVRTGAATPNHRETVNSRHSSWVAQYSLRSIGLVRKQADDLADEVRALMFGFVLPVGPVTLRWTLSDVVFNQLGAVNKVGNDENATFEVDDVVSLWLDRKRA